MDPPPFAYKQPAQFTVGDIKGRVIIKGGEGFEESGDTLIFHNGAGASETGLITHRVVPRFTQTGIDPDTGEPIFEQQLDENDQPIADTFQSIEGFGLNIPLEGFVGPDTVRTFGVLVEAVEHLDLRLADEQPPLTNSANRDDTVYVALLEQRNSEIRGPPDAPANPLLSDAEPMRLTIVTGEGDDHVFLRQITGDTTVLGGPGIDHLTLSDSNVNKTLGGLNARILYDGDGHIDEQTRRVANLTEIGFPEDLELPDVFANTGDPDTAQSFTDARGNEVLYWDADLQPILFQEAQGLALRTVVLRDDGDIVTDLVREEGVPEEGVQETGRHKANDLENSSS